MDCGCRYVFYLYLEHQYADPLRLQLGGPYRHISFTAGEECVTGFSFVLIMRPAVESVYASYQLGMAMVSPLSYDNISHGVS